MKSNSENPNLGTHSLLESLNCVFDRQFFADPQICYPLPVAHPRVAPPCHFVLRAGAVEVRLLYVGEGQLERFALSVSLGCISREEGGGQINTEKAGAGGRHVSALEEVHAG